MKFIKGRWFPLTIAIGIVAIVAFVMALFGWRIIYAPELESKWDAVSAFAAWAGVTMSFVAIMVAIWIPKKIADRQDKIALFEKRHDAYSAILSIEVFSKAVDKDIFREGSKDENGKVITTGYKVGLCCLHFASAFGYYPQISEGYVNYESMIQTLSVLKQYEVRAMTLIFLFPATNEEEEEMRQGLSEIFEPLLCFMTEVSTYSFDVGSKIDDMDRQRFIAALKDFKEKYAERFEHELKI